MRSESDAAHQFISFIHRNYPREEENTYRRDDFKKLAKQLQIKDGLEHDVLLAEIRKHSNYMDLLRNLDF